MKVLWIINDKVVNPTQSIGWIQGYLDVHYKESRFNLYVLYPSFNIFQMKISRFNNVIFVPFYKSPLIPFTNIPKFKIGILSKIHLKKIINKVKPSLMHIFGSEFEHSYYAALYFNQPNKTIVHIQGLTSEIYKWYDYKVPFLIKVLFLPNDLFKGNIYLQKFNFFLRGLNEIKLLKFIHHVTGRTQWDHSIVKKINPHINYYHVNENLREEFYNLTTQLNKNETFTIYMSQASYPIKGIHTLIKYFGILKKRYHLDFLINVSGKSLFSNNFLYNFFYLSSYGFYVLLLTIIYNVKINFLGRLNAKSVKIELLKSHLFISSSLIENSSNAIGEAMITRIPILASNVGGTTSLIKDQINGFIYSLSIKDDFLNKFLYIFNNFDKINLTENQQNYSNLFYNPKDNYFSLVNVYEQIH